MNIVLHLQTKLLEWERRLQTPAAPLDRSGHTILLFFHGYALAHTLRNIVIGRSLKARGYEIAFAGRGPHAQRVEDAGFTLHDVVTLPQERMDRYVAAGDYAYYDRAWTHACVASERAIVRKVRPSLLIHDLKPTVSLTAQLEGIDEVRITQAYNHPAYAHPFKLPAGLTGDIGPFDEYLAQHADQVQTRRQLMALADVPQVHPVNKDLPGYIYVGPLLDRPPRPEHLPLVDAGWDLSQPLIYVTCGSSGMTPSYLPKLIQQAADLPYRFLITTAGRAKPGELPANVRMVDFVPGEWVLQKAQVLVGIVGIGAIYQALAHGVPVVAAAEHLDQAYHLARLQALGVGVQIDRRQWDATNIIDGIETVLKQHDAFARRAAALQPHVDAWQGAEVFVDAIDSHFRLPDTPYRLDGATAVPAEQFLRSLDASTPSALNVRALRRMLRRGRGVPQRRVGGRLLYDRLDTWNWLYDRQPAFFAADHEAKQQQHRRFLGRRDGRLYDLRPEVDYRVSCRLKLYPGTYAGRKAKLFLPFPIVKKGVQEKVRLLKSWPQTLAASLLPDMGGFYGYAQVLSDEPLDIGYTCQVRVRPGGVQPDAAAPAARYLEVEEGLGRQPLVVAFLQTMPKTKTAGVEATARAIYERLLEKTRFSKTRDRSHTQTYSLLSVLGTGRGHCITLSQAFIALCRLLNIAARPACGALIGYPEQLSATAPESYRARSYCEPLFGHTWAEFYSPGKGWVPVEFHAMVLGDQAATPDNSDADLRSVLAADGPLYRDYYFGRVDAMRLHCSPSVRQLPLCLVEADNDIGWEVPADLCYDLDLYSECLS